MTCDLNSWALETVPVLKVWDGLAFGEGLFVAVANARGVLDNDMVITSGDGGITWVQRTTPGNVVEWTDVCYGNSIFVACAEGSADQPIMFSANGTSGWTFATSGSSGNNWRAITYDADNARFIAVAGGNSNRCINSADDAVTWTHRAIQDEGWRAIHADHGIAIAVGDSGAVSTSPDGGVTWTARTAAASNNWSSITYAPWLGMWVAVSNTGTSTNRVMTSTNDGASWTSRTSASGADWTDITQTGFLLVAIASGSDDIQYSDDGITWVLAASAKSASWTAIAFGDGILVAITPDSGDTFDVERAACNNDINVALTGVGATSSLGSMLAARTLALTGVLATGAVGLLVSGQPLTGVAATGSPGLLTADRTLALTGVGATGSLGTLVPGNTEALTGVAATPAAGTLGLTNVHALTGLLATGLPGNLGVEVNSDVTVALTGVLGVTSLGIITPSGGNFPLPPFTYQLLLDGPRYAVVRIAPDISVELVQSLLVDPQDLSSIIPDWPSGPKASRLAIERVQYSTPAGLDINLWWAGPTPVLALTLNGTEELDFTAKGFLQNNAAGSAGQILISTTGLVGNQSFSVTLKLVKQGALG